MQKGFCMEKNKVPKIVVADTGPLISLAFADSLELLLKLPSEIVVLDVVYLEATQRDSEDGKKIKNFIAENNIDIVETERGAEIKRGAMRKRHDGERAVQDYLFDFADRIEQGTEDEYALLLFEDNKIKSMSFILPDNVYLLTTKSFLLVLEHQKVIRSAEEIRQKAVDAGRNFSAEEINRAPKKNPSVGLF
jgi:hypothetical protein